MVIATRYVIKRIPGSGLYSIRNVEAPACPVCGALLSGYDTRLRCVLNDTGQNMRFQLRRLRCPTCCRLHLEIPDFMAPHKHYSASVIKRARAGDIDTCPADDSTIRRWKR